MSDKKLIENLSDYFSDGISYIYEGDLEIMLSLSCGLFGIRISSPISNPEKAKALLSKVSSVQSIARYTVENDKLLLNTTLLTEKKPSKKVRRIAVNILTAQYKSIKALLEEVNKDA